jgi:hypothetical protein
VSATGLKEGDRVISLAGLRSMKSGRQGSVVRMCGRGRNRTAIVRWNDAAADDADVTQHVYVWNLKRIEPKA